MRILALPVLVAGCAAQASAPPPVVPPRASSGFGQIMGQFVSPMPNEPLTVSYLRGEAVVETATAPSGGFDVKLPAGRYRLQFATARGPIASCETSIEVTSDKQTWVNQAAPPPGCPVWIKFDEQHPYASQRGTLADVKTKPGTYDGYEVVPCDAPDHHAILLVRGNGPEQFPSSREDQSAFNVWVHDKKKRIETTMRPMAGGTGFGISCRTDTPRSFNLYVSDYRQVDEHIARLADVIRDQRLGTAFTIKLIPIAVDL